MGLLFPTEERFIEAKFQQVPSTNDMSDKRGNRGGSRRQSRRISARIRFEVFGRDENGHRFAIQTETRNVCREGGCLVMDRDITPGNPIKLTSVHGMNFAARVHWCLYDLHNNVRLVGFKLSDQKKGWVVIDLPAYRRAPFLSPVQTATPEFVLAGAAQQPLTSPVQSESEPSAAESDKPESSALRKEQSFWWRLSSYLKIPPPIRLLRITAMFWTEQL